MQDKPIYGAVELGGTKIVLAVGDGDGRIVARSTIPTRVPELVMPDISAFFRDCGFAIRALGIGAFGPIVVDPRSDRYGRLLETNKPGWSGFDLVGSLTKELGLPIKLVTDVGAAAIGEQELGALRGAGLGIYLTVGTGIGGAIVCNGEVLPAMLHPEMGHVALSRLPGDDAPSTCRFHAHCAEGLAAGPAIIARFGKSLSHFEPGGGEHLMIADYLGQLCAALVMVVSPHRIVLGGGVGKTPGLIEEIQRAIIRHLGGYGPASLNAPGFVCPPALGQDAGIVGALICAAIAPLTSKLSGIALP
jgi:fructokinase